jgi:fatty acid desaturase
MSYINSLNKSRNKTSWKQIRYVLIAVFTSIAWGWNLAPKANAAPIYDAFVDYSTTKITAIMAGFPVAGPLFTVLFTAFANLIPWAVLMMVGGIVVWQAYLGYQEYDRENFSGIVKPMLNIIVLVILVIATDRIVTFMFKGT